MAITLVLTMSMSIVALADEPVVASEEVVEEVVSEEPYEKQGEQIITADDIVIEDLE